MVADEPSAADMERLAGEFDDFTILYTRRNPAGLWVRDAKFVEDAGDVDMATLLFAGHVAGAEVRVCAVLRGKVATVDDVELADDPVLESAARSARFAELDGTPATRNRYTVYGCWDTGDGPRRYSKFVEAASPLHAELLVRADKTLGVFLVAGVVEGWIPVEDTEAVWATVDGKPPVVEAARRPWWRRWL